MFSSSSASAVDPEQERDPPPPPSLVYFPQNDLDEESFKTNDDWANHIPDLFKRYSSINKPAEVSLEHLRALNLSIKGEVDLESLVPVSNDGHDFLPPSRAPNRSGRNSLQLPANGSAPAAPAHKFPLLSNGHKAPDDDTYSKYLRELTCENDDALRVLQKKKARPGHSAPNITHFRRLWSSLELVSGYWDSSLDHYYEAGSEPAAPVHKSPRGFKRLSLALSSGHSESSKHKSGQRYKGRRIGTGSKMPDQFRVEMLRQVIEPIAWAFGCISRIPRKVPQLEIGSLRLPVTQTAVLWRNSQDKMASKHGVTEGPLLGCQCRGETGFMRDKHTSSLDAAREIAGLLLIAEERAREGKAPVTPGADKWWTSKPRWGGGPGGEFGEAEGNKDHPSSSSPGRRVSMPISMPSGPRKSEEDIWKELKPGPGLYDSQHTYLAVGKDRAQQFDTVYMISCLYHHVAILKMTIHPSYVDFLVSGKPPQTPPSDPGWSMPQVERSRWFDLLLPFDRGEAFRGIWGVMSYLMRSGDNISQSYGQRQKSDSHQHHFSFRRKSLDMTPAKQSQRSHSVAF